MVYCCVNCIERSRSSRDVKVVAGANLLLFSQRVEIMTVYLKISDYLLFLLFALVMKI